MTGVVPKAEKLRTSDLPPPRQSKLIHSLRYCHHKRNYKCRAYIDEYRHQDAHR